MAGRLTSIQNLRGREALEQLFPGLSAELLADGAVPNDVLADSMWFLEGGWLARHRDGLDGLLMSRPFLEAAVRRRVRRRANVRIHDGCAIDGLILEHGRVAGVRIGSRTRSCASRICSRYSRV